MLRRPKRLKTGVSARYIEGFLAGQAIAYCEMVSRGVRLAGQMDVPAKYAAKLRALVEQEGCLARLQRRDRGRVALWIFSIEGVDRLIDALEKAPMPSDVAIWSMGKLFGYGDWDVLNYVRGLAK